MKFPEIFYKRRAIEFNEIEFYTEIELMNYPAPGFTVIYN